MMCLHPIKVNGQLVPCGRCPACMRNKQQDWVFRLSCTQRSFLYTYFVTLTYRDEDVHYVSFIGFRDDRKGVFYPPVANFPCLCKRDIQTFLKRLRKSLGFKIKYFVCGEYGETTFRPHYHMLLFSDFPISPRKVFDSWKHQDLEYNCFGLADGNAASGYVTKYLTKKIGLPFYILYSDLKIRPFNMCSQGLGLQYFEENPQIYEIKLNRLEDSVLFQGYKMKMPRYLREKLFSEDSIKEKLQEKNNKFIEDKNLMLNLDLEKRGIDRRTYIVERYNEIYRKFNRNKKSEVL